MVNKYLKREVDGLIAALSPGDIFSVPQIYDACSNREATLSAVSYIVRISPMVECLGRANHAASKFWRRI